VTTSIEFAAPWSKSLRTVTTCVFALLAVMCIGAVLSSGRLPPAVTLVLIGLPTLIVALAWRYTVRGYALTANEILVKRGGWITRLPLADLQSVAGDAEAMRGSLRLFGNGGLFSFVGYFWNRRLGRYRALATDPDRAVVLRYPRRTIVITPHDPQHFIVRARTALKTAR
jgi:hypothetical protein